MTVFTTFSFCPECENDGSTKVTNEESTIPTSGTWTQEKAILMASYLEAIAKKHGYHVALTGGCLYKTGPRKDVDFIIYPHRVALTNHLKSNFSFDQEHKFAKDVAKHLCLDYEKVDNQKYGDDKTIYKVDGNIDLIFL